MQCKRIYCPRSHELEPAENCGYCSGNGFVLTLFGKEFSLPNLFINFFLKRFGKEYAQHAEIVKELAQRNDEIYRTVMVSIFVDHFVEKTLANSHKTTKFAKVFSLESFPLYGIVLLYW